MVNRTSFLSGRSHKFNNPFINLLLKKLNMDPKQIKFSKEFRAKISGSPKKEYVSFGLATHSLVNKVIG
jgi:hypothetical protein